jgi:oxygen-independent coproporphyrinogen-3 oxidase
LKYWTRQPYLGFGVDAHSMLFKTVEGRAPSPVRFESRSAVRFATPDSLDAYMNRGLNTVTAVSEQAAIEESFFLGLRLNRGVDIEHLREKDSAIAECIDAGLLEQQGKTIRLTARGRLLSNEVFARFLVEDETKEDETKSETGHTAHSNAG